MSQLPPDLTIDLVREAEIPEAHKIETQVFPPDEAGSIEQFIMRQKFAPDLFLGGFLPSSSPGSNRTIVGFICATRSVLPTLTGESMKKHDPEGSSVCVHGVVVAPGYQRRGIAVALLNEFLARVRKDGLTKRVLLICHENLRSLYEKTGFEYVGPSPVMHGALPWHEMRIILDKDSGGAEKQEVQHTTPPGSIHETSAPSSGSLPPGLLETLQQTGSSRNRPPARLLPSFPGGINDLIGESGKIKTNKHDLLCPRPGCGSVILKAGVGHPVEKQLPQLVQGENPPAELLTPLPSPGTDVSCWLVQPNPMAFENIGFSRAVDRVSGSEGPRLKLLSCADCDLGPLGWCLEGGREFWLLCERVGYRV